MRRALHLMLPLMVTFLLLLLLSSASVPADAGDSSQRSVSLPATSTNHKRNKKKRRRRIRKVFARWTTRGGANLNDSSTDAFVDEDSSSSDDNLLSRLLFGSPQYDEEATTSKEEQQKISKQNKKRLQFLDRIALISSQLLQKEQDAQIHPQNATRIDDMNDNATQLTHNDQKITPQSDLLRPGRHVHIVTTASLPWFTGTAVNPLLRAAYLHRRLKGINQQTWSSSSSSLTAPGLFGNLKPTTSYVTLVIPWLELEEDQNELYHQVFLTEQEQERYIRDWLRENGMADVADELDVVFYPARYHSGLRSIFAMGDILQHISSSGVKMDTCILEEPEHCNWYRAPGDGWTQRFDFVVGIVHTNYREYANSHYSGLWTAPALAMISSAMVRAYCHQVVKLSDTLQTYAPEKEVTSNVHGVRHVFIEEGWRRAATEEPTSLWSQRARADEEASSKQGVYFIGKLLWAKGLDILLELEDYYKQCTGEYFGIDIYGSGPDQENIMRAFYGRHKPASDSDDDDGEDSSTDVDEELDIPALKHLAKLKQKFDAVEFPKSFAELKRRQPIPAAFLGRVDHAALTDYNIFVNPSVSEVLCTTTAEALAMGKFVILPVHPSNTFFLQFPNCLAYRDKFEFVANLRWALTHNPEPLTEEQSRQFTWEAATDRLMAAAAVTQGEARERERLGLSKLDERIAWFHNEIGKGATGDMLRKIFGAGPASHQVKYQKSLEAVVTISEVDESEDEDDGLSAKFRRSSFAEAIRETIADVTAFSRME